MEILPEANRGNYIERGVIYINDPSTCFICKKTDLDVGTKFCPECGFPQGGEEAEQKMFYRQHITQQMEYNEALKSVKGGQQTLFWTSGLCLLSGLIGSALSSARAEDPNEATYSLIGGIVLAVIFVGLGIMAKEQPLVAIISGFAIFITVNLLGIAWFVYEGAKGRPPVGIMT